MKRGWSLALALTMLVSMLAGCGVEQPVETAAATEKQETARVAETEPVMELIVAPAVEAEIMQMGNAMPIPEGSCKIGKSA